MWSQGQQFGGEQFPGQQFLNDPMANMAMQYGTSLAGQGKDIVHKNVRHISLCQVNSVSLPVQTLMTRSLY